MKIKYILEDATGQQEISEARAFAIWREGEDPNEWSDEEIRASLLDPHGGYSGPIGDIYAERQP